MSAITAKASRKMKKYAVLTREPRCFLGSFDFSWEQRKLSEITDKVTEKNAGLQYVETFTNSAEFGIISQRDFFDHDIAKLGSLDGYYIVKTEDFVYNPRISTSAPVGPINRNKLGRTGVMSPLYTVFRPHDIDTTYLEYFFKCGYWHSFMNFNGDSGARSDRFSIRDNVFFQMPIPIPDIDEQRKIGELLTCLDNLITLHQCKCQIDGCRFQSPLAITWEQRKLGDWGDFYYGRSCPKWSVTEDATIPCIRYGELYTKFGAKIDRVYSYTNMPPDNLRFSKGTEVLIPRVGEDPMDYNHCTWLSMQDVAIGEMISVFNTDNNPLFTATMFNATLQNEFAMRVEGGSVTNLYFEKLKNIEVSFPSIPEQEKIASYFENFDNLITLHQQKCEELKKIKKFMLQKMFV